MTVLILRGSEEIKQFLRPHDKEQEIETWTCPICGNTNRGLYYSHEAPCPRCGEFRHPKLDARTGYPPIRAMSDRLETLRSDKSDLEDQVEGLRREIYELEEEIGEYNYEIINTEAIISDLRGQRTQDIRDAIRLRDSRHPVGSDREVRS